MLHSKKIAEPWHSFLGGLDQKATGETRLDCMGGFVVTQCYGFSRETSDLTLKLWIEMIEENRTGHQDNNGLKS
jgi:hypothetical protein